MSIQSDIQNPYEIDVKKFILDNQALFGSVGKAQVVFEKALPDHRVIADALIFDEFRGIIGVEIKTEHDTTRRLNKQLGAYEVLADEVWVVIHDSQYEKVLKVLNTYHHDSVGIITYSVYQDTIIAGIVRNPTRSPKFQPKDALRMLWKKELMVIANSAMSAEFISQARLQAQLQVYETSGHLPNNKIKHNATVDGHSVSASVRLSKSALVDMIANRLGLLGAHQLVVDMFIAGTKAPSKVLRYYHFKEPKQEVDGIYD